MQAAHTAAGSAWVILIYSITKACMRRADTYTLNFDGVHHAYIYALLKFKLGDVGALLVECACAYGRPYGAGRRRQ